MGWLEGLLTGYYNESNAIDAQKMREAELANDRESRVYTHLLNSEDPEIRAMAGTGMLQSSQARRRSKGLQGWMGEMQTNPIYPTLMQYLQTPKVLGYEDTRKVTTPEQAGYLPTSPPGIAPAAQTSTQTTVAGEPPPAPVAPLPEPELPSGSVSTHAEPELDPVFRTRNTALATPPPPLESVGRAMKPESLVTHEQRPIVGLPHAFPTAEETATAASRAKALGDVRGDLAGYTEMFKATGLSDPDAQKKAADLVMAEKMRARGGMNQFQSVYGEYTDEAGNIVPVFAGYDKASNRYVGPNGEALPANFRKVQSGLGQWMTIAKNQLGYYGGVPADAMPTVIAKANDLQREAAKQRGLGSGEAAVTTELNKPIGVTAGRELGMDPTTPLSQLQGITPLDTDQKKRIFQVQQVETDIDEITSLLPKVFPNVDVGFGGRVKTAFALGGEWLKGNPDLAQLDAAISVALGNIAKLGGDTGTLSTQDVERARTALANTTPSLFHGDTLATAQARIKIVKELLQRAKTPVPGYLGAPPQPPPGGAGTPGVTPPLTSTVTPAAATPKGPTAVKKNGQWVIVTPQ